MSQKVILSVLLFFGSLMISHDRCCGQENEGEIVIISEKIGDKIDIEESKIYGLFRSTKGFQSAVLYKYPDSVYAFKVIYKDEVSGEKRVKWKSLGIDFGLIFHLSISYSVRRNEKWFMGFNLGVSWEDNFKTFETNIWDVLNVDLFLRYQPNKCLHTDCGVSYLSFSRSEWEPRGRFLGGIVGFMLGKRHLFLGSQFRVGVATGYGDTEFGVIARPFIRVLITL